MDRQKIVITVLLILEAGILGVVLMFSALTNTATGVKNLVNDKKNEQSHIETSESSQQTVDTEISGTEDDTESSQSDGSWFASETRETFSDAVEAKLASMTTEEKVAQLFIISPEALTGVDRVTISGNGTRDALAQYPVGGLLYDADNFMGLEQAAALINGAQEHSQTAIGLPLFVVIKEGAPDYAGFATVNVAAQDKGMLITEVGDAPALPEGILASTYSSSLEVVAAIKSGMNMIYEPADFVETYEAVLEAVNDGTISQVRLENAVGSVLSEKLD